jgi:RNA polymerase sigma-70 factor (ECF subfamily)
MSLIASAGASGLVRGHAVAPGEIVDPDAALVAAARSDPAAFLPLYERYFVRVLGYVRVRVSDRAACEDVTSQTFTTALAKLSSFNGRSPFAAWLFAIARNTVTDEQRRRRRSASLGEETLTELAASDASPEQRVLDLERVRRLRGVIAEMPRDKQHLLALRYGAGLSFEELGASLGVGAGTARVRLHRVVEELRKRYPNET